MAEFTDDELADLEQAVKNVQEDSEEDEPIEREPTGLRGAVASFLKG